MGEAAASSADTPAASPRLPLRGPIDLSAHAKLRFGGGDRVRFLNGQVSNDVRRADDRHALPACVCSLKGKLDALVHITVNGTGDDEALLVDGPAELRSDDALFNRFDRYLIADDVELEDVSSDYALWHFLPGTDRPDLPGAVWKSANRFGVEGHDLWLVSASAEKLVANGSVGALIDPDSDGAEALRIRHRIPKWGAELNADVLPAEAGLDLSAVDFHKGCYTGQEVVSRIKSVGRVNRSLCLLAAIDPDAAAAELSVGDALFAAGDAENGENQPADSDAKPKPLGHLTSVTRDPQSGEVLALGYVRRGHSDPKTRLVSVGQTAMIANALEIREV